MINFQADAGKITANTAAAPSYQDPTRTLPSYFVVNYDGAAIHLWKVENEVKSLIFARPLDLATVVGPSAYIGFTGRTSF